MRLSTPFACLLLLSFSACDSNDRPDVTGLGVCSFSATIEGIGGEEFAGRAFYEGYFYPDTSFYRVEMRSPEGTTASGISLASRSANPPMIGTFAFAPPAESYDEAWSGYVEGAVPLHSTGGTLEILRFTRRQIEGRFNMLAETDDGQIATISGRFNAGDSCPRS